MGYKEVRNAIQTHIENNLTKVSPTSYKVLPRIPEALIDASGFSVVVIPPTSAFGLFSTTQCTDIQTWTIDVYSPNIGTSYRAEREDQLLEYAERLVTVFTDVRILASPGIVGVKPGTLRFNDGDFPINSNATKYHFALTLIVEYSRARAC